jgi:hypothetical protein
MVHPTVLCGDSRRGLRWVDGWVQGSELSRSASDSRAAVAAAANHSALRRSNGIPPVSGTSLLQVRDAVRHSRGEGWGFG